MYSSVSFFATDTALKLYKFHTHIFKKFMHEFFKFQYS